VPATFTFTVTVPVFVPVVAPAPVLAVTVASLLVVSVVAAVPLESVDATALLNVPAVVENVTGTSRNALPDVSDTVADIVLVPPVNGTVVGLAVTEIRPAAAAPTVILSAGFAVSAGLAPPETARISATPEVPAASNVAVATPLTVRASTGLRRPKLVENVTVVPFWTGVPELSSKVAVTCAVPFDWTMVLLVPRVMVVPLGASNGTLSHPTAVQTATTAPTHAKMVPKGREPVKMENIQQ
jgi:hypothetical protein